MSNEASQWSKPGAPDKKGSAMEFMFDQLNVEEEGLFARDYDGQLVRLVESTAADYDTKVALNIDGKRVVVKKAVPLKDAQGNVVIDKEGRTIPRSTTIYDAAAQLFCKKPGDVNPIPTLCHREHMQPVGACRVCVVELFRTVDGKRRGAGTLVPACHHRVEDDMEVQTIESPNDPESGERVRSAVRMLTELLAADHLQSGASEAEQAPNELVELAQRLGVGASRFAPRPTPRGQDNSSVRIAVNHDSCILCDRCIRACSDVKENYVIGRSGKGYDARIAFDWGDPMGQSSCVSCGECMVSCPTDALMFLEEVRQDRKLSATESPVTAEELRALPLFSQVPYKFLQWNSSSVVRQRLKPGEVLCREGDYGREAFLLIKGSFQVTNSSVAGHEVKQRGGMWNWLGKLTSRLETEPETLGKSITHNNATPGKKSLTITPDDLIIGEMTCKSYYPRSATVTAITDDAEVLRINRNVLYMLQRTEASRRLLDGVYRNRVLDNQLESIDILRALSPEERKECVRFLRNVVELTTADPGQIIFHQDDKAYDFYMVRLGFVKVSQEQGGQQRVLQYLGPGSHFGEIGILTALTEELEGALPTGMVGRRTATCSALDDVELVRIRGEYFRELWKKYPAIREPFLDYSRGLLEKDEQEQVTAKTSLPEFLDQGLFNAQKLLVLDLESCTRCDECTKACSDTHGGVTRLVREGLRFDKWLVAGSCRSCLDPYCLVGCPVDAIHREGSMEIKIEDHCIGCGQCASNCPYGNINMHGFPAKVPDRENPGKMKAVVQQRATTCDLCRDIVRPNQDPSCVYACPHNAAFRMSGEELLDRVTQDR